MRLWRTGPGEFSENSLARRYPAVELVVDCRPRWAGCITMRRRVLLAENNSMVARALVRLLSADFEVVAVVASGEDLIDQAGKLSPDAIVSDVGLDGLDGISATVEIRRRFPTIPILLATGDDVDVLRHSAIGAGAFALLPKSDLKVLVDILHQLLPRTQQS